MSTTATTTGDAAVQVDQLVMRYGAVTAVEQVVVEVVVTHISVRKSDLLHHAATLK